MQSEKDAMAARRLNTVNVQASVDQSWVQLCVCGVTAASAIVELFNAVTSLAILNSLATHYPVLVRNVYVCVHAKCAQRYDTYITGTRRSMGRLIFVTIMKMFLSLGCLGAAIALECYYRQNEKYILIGMELFAGAMALASALADVHALSSYGQYLLGLKTSVGGLAN
jgi:hypothetical protein